MTCIYKITNPLGEVYIGQTRNLRTRVRQHKCSTTKSRVNDSFKKHGFDNHKIEVLQSFNKDCCLNALNIFERYFIEKYTNDGVTLFNIAKGGSNMTNEIRNKLKEARTGVERTSFKGNLNPYYGKTHSDEVRSIISRNNSMNRRGTKNGRHRAILQYDLNGNILREWDTVTNASKSLNINRLTISSALRGDNKTAKGFIFKYKTPK